MYAHRKKIRRPRPSCEKMTVEMTGNLVLRSNSSKSSDSGQPAENRSLPLLLLHLGDSQSTDNAQLTMDQKANLSETLGAVFQDQSWGKGTNSIREHVDVAGSFKTANDKTAGMFFHAVQRSASSFGVSSFSFSSFCSSSASFSSYVSLSYSYC